MEWRRDCKFTLVALVLGLALGARLRAVLALVLVAGAAHREPADVAGGEDVPLRRGAHAVAADLAHLPAPAPPRLLHTHSRLQDSVFLSQDPPPNTKRNAAGLGSPATHHAVRVALHGRRARQEPTRELAWVEPSRHEPAPLPRSEQGGGARISTASPAARVLVLVVGRSGAGGLTMRGGGEEGGEKRTGHRTAPMEEAAATWVGSAVAFDAMGLRIDKRLLQRGEAILRISS